jgi:hypothetical protein
MLCNKAAHCRLWLASAIIVGFKKYMHTQFTFFGNTNGFSTFFEAFLVTQTRKQEGFFQKFLM